MKLQQCPRIASIRDPGVAVTLRDQLGLCLLTNRLIVNLVKKLVIKKIYQKNLGVNQGN